MRSAISRSALAPSLAMVLVSAASAAGTPCWKQYDVNTVTTISGTIEELTTASCSPTCSSGIHLIVRTDGGSLEVRLGPAASLNDEDIELREGDHIEVTGSEIEAEDGIHLLAQEISISGETLTLRDTAGLPVRAGSRGCCRRDR